MWHASERDKHAREKKFASLANMRQKHARAIILRNYRNLTIPLMKHYLCFEVLNDSSFNFKACFTLFQDGLRWGDKRNRQINNNGEAGSLLLSLLFPRLPVIRVLFPSGPQCFPLDQPASAYNHYYILLVPDIPLFRYGTAFALLSITPAMSKWAQCFTSTNSFNYKLLLHIYFTTANKQTTYMRKG